LLHIDLARPLPEAKARRIEIKSGANAAQRRPTIDVSGKEG
jgi:hypothetical protein